MPRIVDFTVEKLGALRVLLEDGTTIDVQLLPVRITDTGNRHPNGEPMYEIQFIQTVDQRPPEGRLALESLKKGAS